jgi:hypothetical protein
MRVVFRPRLNPRNFFINRLHSVLNIVKKINRLHSVLNIVKKINRIIKMDCKSRDESNEPN